MSKNSEKKLWCTSGHYMFTHKVWYKNIFCGMCKIKFSVLQNSFSWYIFVFFTRGTKNVFSRNFVWSGMPKSKVFPGTYWATRRGPHRLQPKELEAYEVWYSAHHHWLIRGFRVLSGDSILHNTNTITVPLAQRHREPPPPHSEGADVEAEGYALHTTRELRRCCQNRAAALRSGLRWPRSWCTVRRMRRRATRPWSPAATPCPSP